ncbi:MAG: 3-dehydroquinate synthase [Flavobacteriaceae bacterium]|nr:3-dehydroquinate synthase [Flavobacteriaceae bacterium]
MKSDLYSTLIEKVNSGNFSSIFILVDENTEKYCLDIFLRKSKFESFNQINILSGESNKNIESCISIWDQLNSFKADRKSLLINLGGGVLTDIGGFAASTYLRGIKFINIPTTLLGMVDAAHGGKTGIDFKLLKNQIGVFNEPIEVLLDNEYLQTLSKEEYINGYAEVVKHSLLTANSALNFNSLIKLDLFKDSEHIINSYSQVKNEIVESDKYESNNRKVLNFGHTIGHAVESYSHISEKINDLKHGEAIVIGIITEIYISHKKFNFPLKDVLSIKEHLKKYFILIPLNEIDIEGIYNLMVYDKKNEGSKINFVLLKEIGKPAIDQTVDKGLFKESFIFYNE